jgi:hypothetical protein
VVRCEEPHLDVIAAPESRAARRRDDERKMSTELVERLRDLGCAVEIPQAA